MMTKCSHVTVLVKDQDEALRWYTEKLGFTKKSDQEFGPNMRWLTVAAPGDDLEVARSGRRRIASRWSAKGRRG